jgi:ribonuclease BN (tRNA processing enzyme)
MMCWESESRLEGTLQAKGCTTIAGAAETAAKADVKRLVMVHVGERLGKPETHDEREEEVRRFWDGEVVWTEDLTELPDLNS